MEGVALLANSASHGTMQLQQWLDRERVTYTDFARRIGSNHARTVERYAKGQRIPLPAQMAEITRETKGEVTANDFFAVAAE
jgi:hypothetical protein